MSRKVRKTRARKIMTALLCCCLFGTSLSSLSTLWSRGNGATKSAEAASTIVQPKAKWNFSNTSNVGYDYATDDGTSVYYLDNSGNVTSDGTWASFHGDDVLYPTTYSKDPFYTYRASDKTLVFNMKITALTDDWTFPIVMTCSGGDSTFMFEFSPNSSLLRLANSADGDGMYWGHEVTTLSQNTEYQIALVISQGNSIAVHINGNTTPTYSGKSLASSVYESGWSSFSLGGKVIWDNTGGIHNPTGIEKGANGFKIKNVRFYDKAFSSQDITDYYADGEIYAATLQAAHVFTDNMILQRNKPVNIYGSGAVVGRQLTVTFNGQTKTGYPASDGSWCIALDSMNANASGQQLTITDGSKTIKYNNVRVGEVWYAGGQSNQAYSFGELLRDRVGAAGYPTYTAADVYSLPTSTLEQIPELKPYTEYTNYDQIAILKQDYNSSSTVDPVGKANTYACSYYHAIGSITAGEYIHLVGTYDGAKVKLYVNGALAQSVDTQYGDINWPANSLYSRNFSLTVGADTSQTDWFETPMVGRLCEANVYSDAMTDEEALARYNYIYNLYN